MNIDELREYLETLRRQYALALSYQTPAIDYLRDKIEEVQAKIALADEGEGRGDGKT